MDDAGDVHEDVVEGAGAAMSGTAEKVSAFVEVGVGKCAATLAALALVRTVPRTW